MRKQRKRAGQALVEFALFITLLFTILSIVIDLGLAFFAYQGIAGGAAEGASYAGKFSRGNLGSVEIRQRVANEGGIWQSGGSRTSFVNLHDLNSDGARDDTSVWQNHILVSVGPSQANLSLPPTSQTNCQTEQRAGMCDVIVTVVYYYEPIFALAATLGQERITIRATRQMLLP